MQPSELVVDNKTTNYNRSSDITHEISYVNETEIDTYYYQNELYYYKITINNVTQEFDVLNMTLNETEFG